MLGRGDDAAGSFLNAWSLLDARRGRLAASQDWQIFALSDRDDEPAVKLGECPERPDYNVIAEVLEANSIVPKLFRDIGRGKKLVQGVIETTYGDIMASK